MAVDEWNRRVHEGHTCLVCLFGLNWSSCIKKDPQISTPLYLSEYETSHSIWYLLHESLESSTKEEINTPRQHGTTAFRQFTFHLIFWGLFRWKKKLLLSNSCEITTFSHKSSRSRTRNEMCKRFQVVSDTFRLLNLWMSCSCSGKLGKKIEVCLSLDTYFYCSRNAYKLNFFKGTPGSIWFVVDPIIEKKSFWINWRTKITVFRLEFQTNLNWSWSDVAWKKKLCILSFLWTRVLHQKVTSNTGQI